LVAILFSVNFIVELRSLAMQGVPRPWFVMYRRTAGRFIPTRSEPIESLVGRAALISWDIRWLTSGNTMAKVIAVNRIGSELTLRLDKPIVIHATENVQRSAWSKHSSNLSRASQISMESKPFMGYFPLYERCLVRYCLSRCLPLSIMRFCFCLQEVKLLSRKSTWQGPEPPVG
jgi:hypothetical protein